MVFVSAAVLDVVVQVVSRVVFIAASATRPTVKAHSLGGGRHKDVDTAFGLAVRWTGVALRMDAEAADGGVEPERVGVVEFLRRPPVAVVPGIAATCERYSDEDDDDDDDESEDAAAGTGYR